MQTELFRFCQKLLSVLNFVYCACMNIIYKCVCDEQRGKFRPRLQQMVEGNSAASVEDASKKAFKALPNLHDAITALVVLKAVGPATASGRFSTRQSAFNCPFNSRY